MSFPEPSVDIDLRGLWEQAVAEFNGDSLREFPIPVPSQNEICPSDLEPLRNSCYAEGSADNRSKLPQSLSRSQPVPIHQSSLTQSQPGNTPSSSTSVTSEVRGPPPCCDISRSQDFNGSLTNHPSSYNEMDGNSPGEGPVNDHFSVDPRFPQQPRLSLTSPFASSNLSPSPSIPRSFLRLQDDTDPTYGRRRRSSLSRADSAPPSKIPSQPTQLKRQLITQEVILREQQYIKDLDFIEEAFIRPLQNADPPIVARKFIEKVFGNILDLRECNVRLFEAMYLRQQEQSEVNSMIGDVFLNAVIEFRLTYTAYISKLPVVADRLKEEIENNKEFRGFLEQSFRHPVKMSGMDLMDWLNRPLEHLFEYPDILEATQTEITEENPDVDSLQEAVQAMRNLNNFAKLMMFQISMGKGSSRTFEWHHLVPEDVWEKVSKQEMKRQSHIFELIQGEINYVKDLENIEHIFIQPLRSMDPPIIPHERLETFIRDVFNNIDELYVHHKRLLHSFFEIQRAEHPIIRSVAAPMNDTSLGFRDVYMDYLTNYPVAVYRVEEEMAKNPLFKDFVKRCTSHRLSHKLDVKSFINRPNSRLPRYELILQSILHETPAGHVDLDMIPIILETIRHLVMAITSRIVSTERKVELWKYAGSLIFEAGENIDLDLFNANRSLVYSGKLQLYEPGFGWHGRWTQLFGFLFDHYFIMTKRMEMNGVEKHKVYRRPIPLDLLTFTDPSTQRGSRLFPFSGSKEKMGQSKGANFQPPGSNAVNDVRGVYLCTINHSGRSGRNYTLFAESFHKRLEWKTKLEEAIGLKKFVSSPVFRVKTLSADTFCSAARPVKTGSLWNNDMNFTGKVTCSVPFTAPDGHAMVAIGCAKGVWVGLREDPKSIQQVLKLKKVTQCAMLEESRIFLVLADKALFAYHVETLVPSSPGAASLLQIPQKLSGNKDVQFFTIGDLGGRTLLIYMNKSRSKCVFQVLEPVIENTSEKSDWFHISCDFSLQVDSYDLIFMEERIMILCNKGFKIMDLSDLEGITVPQKEDLHLKRLSKRLHSCRPIGMFMLSRDRFFLCYDEFGLYVDKHGKPSNQTRTFEWEGKAEKVAWNPPYILLFNSQFIEIHHMENGYLAQIISGDDIQCTWDGQGTNKPQNMSQSSVEFPMQEIRVHGVMNKEVLQLDKSEVLAQHVFELVLVI